MDVSIKKVGERDGAERFILVNSKTRDVITKGDASERAIRRYFHDLGTDEELISACFQRARHRYAQAAQHEKEEPSPSDANLDASDTVDDDDLLFELGLDDNEHAR